MTIFKENAAYGMVNGCLCELTDDGPVPMRPFWAAAQCDYSAPEYDDITPNGAP